MLNFKVTTAGLDLLANVGTIGPVVLDKIALGSAGYEPDGSEAALTAQIKQIVPEGSSTPGPGKIHITASDTSNDAYTVREIGIFSGATLFAVCSQAVGELLIKTADNGALFAIDLDITSAPPESVTIGDASFQYPPATETVKGVAEVATQAETDTGTDDERIVTPKKLKAFAGFVKRIGDTMAGFLTLHAHPTATMHAATKGYVDGITPDLSGLVQKSGDTMTGPLVMSGNAITNCPTTAKAWVIFEVSGGACVIKNHFNIVSVSYLGTGKFRVSTNIGGTDLSQRAIVVTSYSPDLNDSTGGRPREHIASTWFDDAGLTVPSGSVGVRNLIDPGGSGTVFYNPRAMAVVIF